MFRQWPDNDTLTIRQLQMKAIVLLSLCLMLRPSDIAPKARHVMPMDTIVTVPFTFSTTHVLFNPDSSCDIIFHGIKQDMGCSGFTAHVPLAVDPKIDTVCTLSAHITRTAQHRPPNSRHVFLTLDPPYRQISANTMSNVLREAISLAGLGS